VGICADNDAFSWGFFQNYPHHITVDSTKFDSLDVNGVGGILSHEIGHSLGLTDAATAASLAG